VTLVFIDTETTSLRHDRRVWEIGLIVRHDDEGETEYSRFISVHDLDLGNADLKSLNIGRYYERHPQERMIRDQWLALRSDELGLADEIEVLEEVEELVRGATIVGAVPNFDTEVLGKRMRKNGICPSWHYHLVDVETLAAGALKMPPPWDFDKVLAAYGLTYDEADRHTALGDARMARDLYDAILGGGAS
jgi:DNA polymerase III epsilon subunit-like protein